MDNPTEISVEEMRSCDGTELRMGPKGVEYWSGKTGKKLSEPVPSPFDQVMQMRKNAGKA